MVIITSIEEVKKPQTVQVSLSKIPQSLPVLEAGVRYDFPSHLIPPAHLPLAKLFSLWALRPGRSGILV